VWLLDVCTVYGFEQKCALEDAIGSHACSLEASMRVAHSMPFRCSLRLPVGTVNSVQTLKGGRSVHGCMSARWDR
jgi:hypothetical protein